jgi:putative ABC transport system permease protein
MTILTTLKKANSNLLRTKFRTFLTILSITIGAITLSLILVISGGFQTWINNQTEGGREVGSFKVVPKGTEGVVQTDLSAVKEYQEGLEGGVFGRNLTEKDIENLKQIKGISRVEKSLHTKVTYLYAQTQDSKKIFSYIDTIYPKNEFPLYAGQVPNSEDTQNILMSYEVAQKLGYDEPKDILNKEIALNFRKDAGGNYTKKVTVLGILRNSIFYNSTNILPEKMIQGIYDQTVIETEKDKNLGYTSLTVIYNDDLNESEVKDMKQNIEKLDLGIMTNDTAKKSLESVLSTMQFGLGMFAMIGLVTGFFGVINTLFTASLERTKEIGLMRALGMSKKGVFGLFAVEATLIGFWSSVVGVGITAFLSFIINQVAKSSKLFGFESGDVFGVSLGNILIVIFSISFITFIAGIIPAIRASNIEPTEALKYE